MFKFSKKMIISIEKDMLSSLYRASTMSGHVFLNLLNRLVKRDKMQGLLSTELFFSNMFNKVNNTKA